MAVYKLIQDIEAEDKLIGPLTLRQFIYAGVAATCLYLSFFSLTKHATILLAIFLPIAIFAGFLAWPWSLNQPTEVWALAKIRFLLKPHRRVWDQGGAKELVTITAPKQVLTAYSNGLSQSEVRSRLQGLADVVDSRGWAIKNVNLNLYPQPSFINSYVDSDRLINPAVLPQDVPNIDIQPADDILDEINNPVAQHFDQMINSSTKSYRQQLQNQLRKVTLRNRSDSSPQPDTQQAFPSSNYQLPDPPSQSSYPIIDNNQAIDPLAYASDDQFATPPYDDQQGDQAVAEELRRLAARPELEHMRTFDPFVKRRPGSSSQAINPSPIQTTDDYTKQMTPATDPAILDFANNNDLNIATIARQVNRKPANDSSQDEVVISLR